MLTHPAPLSTVPLTAMWPRQTMATWQSPEMQPREQQSLAAQASHALVQPVRPRQLCCQVSRRHLPFFLWEESSLVKPIVETFRWPGKGIFFLSVLQIWFWHADQHQASRGKGWQNPCPLQSNPLYLIIPHKWLSSLFLNPYGVRKLTTL